MSEIKRNEFIKMDEGLIIQEKWIRWIKKNAECMNICTKPYGCTDNDTFHICKSTHPTAYDKLNIYFLQN